MPYDLYQLGMSDAVYCCVTENNSQVVMINLDDMTLYEIRYMSIDDITAIVKDHTCIFIEIRERLELVF